MFIEIDLDAFKVRLILYLRAASSCSDAEVGKKKVTSTEKKAEVLTKAFVILYIDICADRIVHILLNTLY